MQAADLFEDEMIERKPYFVKPRIKSPIRWFGGKFLQSRNIISLFPCHVCYCEVFGGAGHILFGKSESSVEVLNDINGELVNFYRVLARFPQWFEYKFKWALYSRQEFEELKNQDVSRLSEEDRAWRFFYLNRCCFAGKMKTLSFGTAINYELTNKLYGLKEVFEKAHNRLKRVIIENRPYAECIDLYDAPETFFYIDPPYFGHENDYGNGIFEKADFERLAEILGNIKGKFLLSINDTPEIRKIFGRFNIIQEVMAHYSANYDANTKTAGNCRKPELLFGNYNAELA